MYSYISCFEYENKDYFLYNYLIHLSTTKVNYLGNTLNSTLFMESD